MASCSAHRDILFPVQVLQMQMSWSLVQTFSETLRGLSLPLPTGASEPAASQGMTSYDYSAPPPAFQIAVPPSFGLCSDITDIKDIPYPAPLSK